MRLARQVVSLNGADTYDLWLVDVVLQSGVTELQTDDVQQPMLVLLCVLVVPDPVLDSHLQSLLCVNVHHVQNAT